MAHHNSAPLLDCRPTNRQQSPRINLSTAATTKNKRTEDEEGFSPNRIRGEMRRAERWREAIVKRRRRRRRVSSCIITAER